MVVRRVVWNRRQSDRRWRVMGGDHYIMVLVAVSD